MENKSPLCISYARFSSVEQKKGHSLKRQYKLSEDYAKKKGLKIDKSFQLSDQGLSAYSGDHTKKGALGKFLELVRAKQIPPGSTLLVESLDRLSRQTILEALHQFMNIIKENITIVTLCDNMEYSKESLNSNIGSLMMSLTIMARAHEESAMKAQRLKAAWKNKRELISEKPLTARVPGWLTLNKETKHIEIIPDRAAVVKKIFELSASGMGAFSIARFLNEKQIPAWISNKGWHTSTILKTLHNRAVLGEFQPHRLDNKKSIPVGDAVADYYPRVISDTLFYKVQERFAEMPVFGGRTGEVSNLFSHIARCGYCGGPMVFVNKGNGSRGGKYLVCDFSKRKGPIKCQYVSFPYNEFEWAFLSLCQGLKLEDLIPDPTDSRANEIKTLEASLNTVSAQLKVVDKKISNFDHQLGIADNTSQIQHINQRQAAAFEEKERLQVQKKNLKKSLSNLMSREATTSTQLKSVQKTLSILNQSKGEDLTQYRLKLRDHIRKLIKKIIVFPDGMKNIVLSYENMPPEYTTIEDINRPHIDAINVFLDSADNKEDIKRATSSIMVSEAEIQNYGNINTGRDKRCFHVFFRTEAFKEIAYDPTLGYYVASELTERNWRIGDSFQIKGDFTANRIKKAKPNAIEYEHWQKDFARRVMAAMEKQNHPAPEIKYEKLLYHPNSQARRAAEITKRIIDLRDKKGLKWIEIKDVLEKENVKTLSGKLIWHPGTLCRMYKKAASK